MLLALLNCRTFPLCGVLREGLLGNPQALRLGRCPGALPPVALPTPSASSEPFAAHSFRPVPAIRPQTYPARQNWTESRASRTLAAIALLLICACICWPCVPVKHHCSRPHAFQYTACSTHCVAACGVLLNGISPARHCPMGVPGKFEYGKRGQLTHTRTHVLYLQQT